MTLKATLTLAFLSCLAWNAHAGQERLQRPSDAIDLGQIDYASRIAKAQKKYVTIGDTPVTKPVGEKENFTCRSNTLYPDPFGTLQRALNTGKAVNIVYGFKDEAYVYLPISQYPTKSYLVCETEESDDPLHPNLIAYMPQPILDYVAGANHAIYYIDRLKVSATPTSVAAQVDTENHEVKYVWKGDHYELYNDAEAGLTVGLGMIDPQDKWIGFLDYNVRLDLLKERPLTGPKNKNTQEWALMHTADNGVTMNGFMVNVMEEDGNFWMKGVGEKILPDAWVKGEIKDKQILFPGATFMGEYEGYNMYFCAYRRELVWNEEQQKEVYEWTIPNQVAFNYSAEDKYISCDQRTCLGINLGKTDYCASATYISPEIMFQEATSTFIPTNPVWRKYQQFEVSENDKTTLGICFSLPRTNVDGQMLDCNNMSYRIFFDEDPFTFYNDEYLYLKEEMKEIPYFFTDSYDIVHDPNETTTRVLYFYGFDMGDPGVVSIYTNPETNERFASDIVYWSGKTGEYVDNNVGVTSVNENQVASSEYFAINGMRVSNQYKGMVIRKCQMLDGTIKTIKEIKK